MLIVKSFLRDLFSQISASARFLLKGLLKKTILLSSVQELQVAKRQRPMMNSIKHTNTNMCTHIYIYILGVGIIPVNYVIIAINLASRLTRLYLSCRLIFSHSFKKKFGVLAQLEAKIQSIKVQVV